MNLKIKYRCNILLSVIIWACSSPVQREIVVIDPRAFEEVGTLYLSDIADSVFFIPLDRTISIGGVMSLKLREDKVYVVPFKGAVHAYDEEGKYIRRYGDRGKGPGEYRNAVNFDVDADGKVYVKENSGILLKYDSLGKYAGKVDYKKYMERGNRFDGFMLKEGKFYLKESFTGLGKVYYNWLIIDSTGQEVGYRKSEYGERYGFDKSDFFCADGHVCYWDPYNDTVFQIDGDGSYKARYLWQSGSFRLPRESFDIKIEGNKPVFPFPEAYVFWGFTELPGHHLFATYRYRDHFYGVFYHKSSGKWLYHSEGFTDDLTGFTYENFFPLSVNSTSSGNFILKHISPLALKDWAGSEDFDRVQVKTPRFKQQLKELADRLEEEDNWVIVVYRLKK